jgi:hypothetical protein
MALLVPVGSNMVGNLPTIVLLLAILKKLPIETLQGDWRARKDTRNALEELILSSSRGRWSGNPLLSFGAASRCVRLSLAGWPSTSRPRRWRCYASNVLAPT